jgi:small subunit ribosomal protein S4e
MTRGPKKHLKRLNAPKHWMLDKLSGVFAPKPTPGPHKERESLPLIVILRNRLKYALNRREAQSICMQKLVHVDGKVRTDMNFPAGFMDVVSMPKSNDTFRLMYDTKGRFVLHTLKAKEASFKLCRVQRQEVTKKGVPVIATHDGRTIRYHHPDIKKNDTVKVSLETGKVLDFIKFEVGNTVMCTSGNNIGRVGVMAHIERHPGAFDIVHVRDAAGNTFATRLANVFVIGKGDDSKNAWVTLPRGQGVKKTIFEQRDARLRRA